MRFFLLSAILFCFTLVSGQSRLNMGVRGGLNYVNNIFQSSERNLGSEYRLGYHIGIQSKIKLLDQFYLSPEISWNNRGYNNPESYAGPSSDLILIEETNTHLNYITIPLVVEYRPFEWIGIQMGPEIGYLISAKDKSDTQTIDLLDLWKHFEIIETKNRFDLGLTGGVELRLVSRINLGLRYVHGFTSLFDRTIEVTDLAGNPLGTHKRPKNQNRTFQLSVSYFIL